ncbi:MAG TPA: hypothetical protein VF914_17680 [Chloroflexia bacterium]|jgi:hypothetical protein
MQEPVESKVAENPVVKRLVGIQQERGLSDRQFATVLGVSNTTWDHTKDGKYPVRWEILVGAVQAFWGDFPELQQDVMKYLQTAERRGVRGPGSGQTPRATAVGAAV